MFGQKQREIERLKAQNERLTEELARMSESVDEYRRIALAQEEETQKAIAELEKDRDG